MGDPEDLVDIGDPVLFCQVPEEYAELNAFVQTTQPSSSSLGPHWPRLWEKYVVFRNNGTDFV